MDVEGRLKSKLLYKSVLYLVKVIPMIISGVYVLNAVLSYFDIDWPGFSYIVFALLLGFVYLISIVFRFCIWHRMFIHYITFTLVVNIIDYHWGILLSDRDIFLFYMITSGMFLFVALWFKLRSKKHKRSCS